MPKVSEEHLEERRRQIMDAALACFSRQGFHRTTMVDIVRESGLSAGAFYRYFESKESIVTALADEHNKTEAAAFARADTAASDPMAALADLVQVSLGRLDSEEQRRWWRITVQLWAEALRDEQIMAIVRRGLDRPLEVLTEVIIRGQDEGTLPSTLDARSTARVCAAIFQGLVLQQAWDPEVDVATYIGSVIGILDALHAAARAETPTGG